MKTGKAKTIAFWISLIGGITGILAFLIATTPVLLLLAGWNFEIIHIELNRNVVCVGDEIAIRVVVKNTGFRTVGTCYGVVKIANAYDHDNPVLDTHRDLPLAEKSKLKVVDIVKGYTKDFTFRWKVPSDLPIGVYDIAVEIWNPPLLYKALDEKRFDSTDWANTIEVRSEH